MYSHSFVVLPRSVCVVQKSEIASDSGSSPLSYKSTRSLSVPDSGYEESPEDILKEMKILRRQAMESEKAITALKLACAVSAAKQCSPVR